MFIIYSLLLILILICGVSILYIVLYNNMQHLITKVDQAESIIDESLRKRYDLITESTIIIGKVVKDKKNIFKDIEKLKDENISTFDLDRKLSDTVMLIHQVKSDYEDLANNKDFKKLMNEIKSTEEKLTAAKSFYNKYTNKLNDLVRKFPSNIIAKMHNIEIRLFFDGKDMHDSILDDFKF